VWPFCIYIAPFIATWGHLFRQTPSRSRGVGSGLRQLCSLALIQQQGGHCCLQEQISSRISLQIDYRLFLIKSSRIYIILLYFIIIHHRFIIIRTSCSLFLPDFPDSLNMPYHILPSHIILPVKNIFIFQSVNFLYYHHSRTYFAMPQYFSF